MVNLCYKTVIFQIYVNSSVKNIVFISYTNILSQNTHKRNRSEPERFLVHYFKRFSSVTDPRLVR